MNQLSNYRQAKVLALLRDGASTRAVAKKMRISKVTVSRYRAFLFGVQIVCECGEVAGHQGWCSFRFQKSPARQRFIASWARRKSRNSSVGVDLIRRLSLRVDPTVQAEVLSEMYMRLASGEYALADESAILADAKKLAAKMARGGWREQFSIDAPLTENGGTLLDFASSDALTPEEELCEAEND